jgi:arginine decarboxylase-like protein
MSQNPIEASRELYNVLRWGDGYFDINAEGHLVAFPTRRREDGRCYSASATCCATG